MVLFFKRVWLGMPAVQRHRDHPVDLLRRAQALFTIPLGLFDLTVHTRRAGAAGIFVLRVGVSVSLAILLILTTKWADILKSLRVLRVPTSSCSSWR